MKTKTTITLIAISIATIIGCTTSKNTALTPEVTAQIPELITFEKHIKPITIKYCSGGYCHHGTPSHWSTYENIKQIVDNGELKEEVIDEKSMPRFKKLPALEYQMIKKWLETGAKEK